MAETTGRVLGLDLGESRIGVAISDPERRIAVPHGTIHVGSPPGELKAVAAMIADNGITQVVVGYPLSMSGRIGEQAAKAENFADALRSVVETPVALHDERLSTVEAERELRSAGIKGRQRRMVVDRSAATVILQAWLDANG